ncbi:MAG: metallophosphoesterase [Paramuribaculum sp.]|nr:metallophosphoesterase [Paramuribaculum sp.]
MRLPIVPILIMAIFCVAIDCYILRISKSRCFSRVPSKIQAWTAGLLYLMVGVAMCLPYRSGDDAMLRTIMWLLFSFFSVYAAKFLFVVFDLIASLPKLFNRKRFRWLSVAGAVGAVVLFLAMWWGAIVNRYRIQIREFDIPVENLPEAFDGMRIVQFSDLHTGTFGTDTAFVSQLVDRINSLNGDVIVFTGDIVNRHSQELVYHLAPLSRLDAPHGVYSIMGNHDYGDYSVWPSEEAKAEDVAKLEAMQRSIGWKLLLNESDCLYADGDSIVIIGVENIGDPPFKVYGSLKDSYDSLADPTVKILLTHNPAHWSQEIAGSKDKKIDLTLSGHTHAMQMEVGGISPACFRYDTWGGLYNDSEGSHPLYVNIGVGTVGMPMRLGATPEITVLTLRKKK